MVQGIIHQNERLLGEFSGAREKRKKD